MEAAAVQVSRMIQRQSVHRDLGLNMSTLSREDDPRGESTAGKSNDVEVFDSR